MIDPTQLDGFVWEENECIFLRSARHPELPPRLLGDGESDIVGFGQYLRH
jgi:hypothetical protein